MAELIKPGPSAALNRGHPLAQGLVAYWPFTEGAGRRPTEFVTGWGPTVSSNTPSRWTAGPPGITYNQLVADMAAGNGQLTYRTPLVNGISSCTIGLLAVFNPRGGVSTLGTKPIICGGISVAISSDGTIDQACRVDFIASSAYARPNTGQFGSGTDLRTIFATRVSGANPNILTGLWPTGVLTAPTYFDRGATAGTIGAATASICGLDFSGNAYGAGTIYWIGIWNRVLGRDEMDRLHRDPWQLIVPPLPYTLVAPTAAAYSIQAVTATYAASPVVANLEFGREASATVCSTTVTTPAASLKVGRVAKASTATAAVTTNAANLTQATPLTRTPLGTAKSNAPGSSWTALTGITLAAGDVLIVAVLYNGDGVNSNAVSWAGNSLGAALVGTTNGDPGKVHYYRSAAGGTGNIVVTVNDVGSRTTPITLLALKVSGLTSGPNLLDWYNEAGHVGTVFDSSQYNVITTNQASEFLVGFVFQQGPVGDAAPNFSGYNTDGITTVGQRDGTSSGANDRTISEAYAYQTSTGLRWVSGTVATARTGASAAIAFHTPGVPAYLLVGIKRTVAVTTPAANLIKSTGPAAYVATASPRTYAVSTVAAGVLVGRRAVGAVSTTTVTTPATALRATRKAAAAVATYAVAVPAGALEVGYRAAASVRIYAASTVAAGLRAARKIAGLLTTYAVTTITAQANSPKKIQAITAAVAVSTPAAVLRFNRPATATTAAVTVSTVVASLKFGRKVVATPTPFTVTAIAAALRATHILKGVVVTYSATAGAAAVNFGRRAVAAVRAYAVTTVAGSLSYGRRAVQTGAAAVAVSTLAAGLRATLKAVASVRTVVVTSINATLSRTTLGAYNAVAGVASYVVSTPASGLRAGRKAVSASASTFAVTTFAAGLRRGLAIKATPASASVVAGTAVLRVTFRASATVASAVVTPRAATLLRSGAVLAAVPASCTVTTKPAAFLLGRRVKGVVIGYTVTPAAAALTWKGIGLPPRTRPLPVGGGHVVASVSVGIRPRLGGAGAPLVIARERRPVVPGAIEEPPTVDPEGPEGG